MTQTPPDHSDSGPPPQIWDALPEIIGKLTNEYLLVTLGYFILVIAIGVYAPGVVDSLGRGFFYLVVVLMYLLAYVNPLNIILAWAYFLMRLIHAYVHTGKNRLLLRRNTFLLSSVILFTLWGLLITRVLTS